MLNRCAASRGRTDSGRRWEARRLATGHGRVVVSEMPASYEGREQTWLKHRVLKLYLEGWAHKIGSFARRLWYVDAFAGPWQSGDTERRDTSIAIGLAALNEAAATWSSKARIDLHAIFVE